MALTKSKITYKSVGKAIKNALAPKPEAFPDFSGKLPYRPNPKRKTFITAPYELPEKPDPNLRTPADQLRPEIKRTGASKMPKEDLSYKEPAWLKKALSGSDMKPETKSTFRESLRGWMQSMQNKGKKATSMKPRKPLFTGRVNQDSQLDKLDN